MATWFDLLVDVVTIEDLNIAKREEAKGQNPIDYLLRKKTILPHVLLSVFSKHYNLSYILDLEKYHPDEEALLLVSEEVARRFLLLPLFQIQENLYVAVADPNDPLPQDYLRQLTGLTVEFVLATRIDLEKAINKFFLTKEKSAQIIGAIAEIEPEPAKEEIGADIHAEDLEAPAIKLVNHIIAQAINLRASDVHLERFLNHVELRYRVDGILHEFPPPPPRLFRSIISRVKIISNLDVAERRQPQDGRARFRMDDKHYDLRISIIPNLHGEGVVIRILDTRKMNMELNDLGFATDMLTRYARLIRKPYGILLVTGPTGSGKTTTIYATLKNIYTHEKKMITLEDPVEYQLDGITQIQVNTGIGFDFAKGLRSILRHDPDIVMLGEMRDLESAEIAIRASLTGHLVFSTIHTNDALSTVTRLVDMGIPRFLVFASLRGIVAQRLLRRLCPDCKELDTPDPLQLSSLGISKLPEEATTYRAAGCSNCGNLGYRGRLAAFELLEVTPQMRQLDPGNLTLDCIRDMAIKQGFVSLRESAMEKFFLGLTSFEEILSLAAED